MNCPDFVNLCLCVLPFSLCLVLHVKIVVPMPRFQFYRRPELNFVYCTTVWRKLLLFDDNFIANAEEIFLPFEIKKIAHDLLLCIGDDCIAMLKNCPDVATCLLMLCGALIDLTIDTVLTFYWRWLHRHDSFKVWILIKVLCILLFWVKYVYDIVNFYI